MNLFPLPLAGSISVDPRKKTFILAASCHMRGVRTIRLRVVPIIPEIPLIDADHITYVLFSRHLMFFCVHCVFFLRLCVSVSDSPSAVSNTAQQPQSESRLS